jgi:TetR/AcrR family transcriptional regulator, tetracycline repressor protein
MPERIRASSPELSVEAIVDAATRIAEQEGFETISMRRLAEEFGVTAMALYGYVSTKHHLLELIADRYMAQLDLATRVRTWDRRLVRIFRSFHELMVAHPILAHVLIAQPVEGPATQRVADEVIGILRDHGFDDTRAVEIFSVLASYTVGFTLSQRSRQPSSPEAASRLRRLRGRVEYPNLSAVADIYLDWPSTQSFDRSIDHLISAYAR